MIAKKAPDKIFLTYAHEDKKVSDYWRDHLEELGFSVWRDAENIQGGKSLFWEINEGLSKCNVYVPFISSAYLKSEPCREEIAAAHKLCNGDPKRRRIIPVLLQSRDFLSNRIPPMLDSKLYIEVDRNSYEEAFAEFLEKGFRIRPQSLHRVRPVVAPKALTKPRLRKKVLVSHGNAVSSQHRATLWRQRRKKVFISHVNTVGDKDFAIRLAEFLRAARFKVFLDVDTMRPGQGIATQINRNLAECDYFIPVLSPRALESRWVNNEIDAAIALSNDSKRDGRPVIISVVLEECAVPLLLRATRYIKFCGRDYEEALEELFVHGLNRKSPKSLVKPSPKMRAFLRGTPYQQWLAEIDARHKGELLMPRPFRKWLLQVAPKAKDIDLPSLLSLRLQEFIHRQSLAEIAVSGFRAEVDAELVKHARGSPKRMFRLGDLLLQETARRWAKTHRERMITRADWKNALRRHKALSRKNIAR